MKSKLKMKAEYVGIMRMALKGGKGGRGNFHFKTPTNQTPRYSQSGLPGKELKIILEQEISN